MLTEAFRRPRAALPMLLLVAATMPGCYLMHVASGQLDMSRRGQPIDELLARDDLESGLRRELEVAVAARDFAFAELGLPDNGSYRRYADLGRRYAVWNLFAAPRYSVEPRRWCYPVTGCVAYRGYFYEAAAVRAARHWAQRGDDVWIGPALAYSTLGHFRDPVLNTMLGQEAAELAGLIFHELAHQLLWVPGDADFNEAFATVVEEEGLRRWFAVHGGPPDGWHERRQRQRDAAERMVEVRERLAALYASGVPVPALAEAKARELDRLAEGLRELGIEQHGRLNNARLAAVSTYYRCLPGLRRELERHGRNLPAFYAAMRQAEGDADARRQACDG